MSTYAQRSFNVGEHAVTKGEDVSKRDEIKGHIGNLQHAGLLGPKPPAEAEKTGARA